MNIFYLDEDPKLCAQYHCDRHCVKMVLETAQLLCTAHWMTGGEAPYKKTHFNHPSNKWAPTMYGYVIWVWSYVKNILIGMVKDIRLKNILNGVC